MIVAVRRWLTLAAALIVATGPLAAAGGAMGKDRREGRGEIQQQMQRGRGDEGRWAGARQAGPPGWRGEGRGVEERGGRWAPQPDPRYADPRYEGRGDPRAEVDPRAYGGGYAPPRRGAFLPQGGPVIGDYDRYRLRAPPRGYDWVRTPGGMALVSRANGRVYDVIPY